MGIAGVSIGATSTIILPNRTLLSLRLKAIFVNNSDEDIYVAPYGIAVSTQGIPLKANGGAYVDEPDTTGWLYQGSWHGICASGGKILSITEFMR